MFKNLFSSLFFIFLVALTTTKAYSVARLETCVPFRDVSGSTPGTGVDGSDCDEGLYCDSSVKACARPTEVVCKGVCSPGLQCIDDSGDMVTKSSGNFGVCVGKEASSSEDNAFSDILCTILNILTGKATRVVVAILFSVTGFIFLAGKIQLQTLLIMLAGIGFLFGGGEITSILVGKSVLCAA